MTPLLTRDQADNYGEISGAEVGTTRLSGGRKFSAEMFDPKTSLYEPVELTDALNRHFLARKIEDHDPRVPPLNEVRSDVILAWKMEKARDLTDRAAREFAEELGAPLPAGTLRELGTVRTSGGKRITAFALDADFDATHITPGTFTCEWPPRSGQVRQFPEVDRAAWFDLAEARSKIHKGQLAILDDLHRKLGG